AQTRLVDGNIVDDGIRPGQVDVLEDTGVQARVVRTLLGKQLSLGGDIDRLARRQIAHQLEPQARQRDAFGRHHVLRPVLRLALAEAYRAHAVRVAERQDAVAGDHRHYRVGALDA